MRSGICGEYYRDCFIIKLNVPIDFSNVGKSDDAEHLGTFFHEYFHFLQNMCTTFGNLSMAVFYAKVRNILYKLANSTEIEISRNIEPNPEIDDWAIRQEIVVGDMDSWTYEPYDFMSITGARLVKDEIWEELGYGDCSLPQIDLFLTQNRKKFQKTLNFGAMSIMESMADMLDRKLYGRSRAEEYVQYHICKRLWDYVVKKAVPSDIIFRCCEYALMDYNPGRLYFNALRIFAKWDVITEDKIDDFFTNCIQPSYKKIYSDMFSEMMNQFRELVPIKNVYTEGLARYVSEFCSQFHELRECDPLLFTQLYRSESDAVKIILAQFMHIAAPLIIDCKNETYMPDALQSDGVGMEEYASFYALYKMASGLGTNKCELFDICKVNAHESISDICLKEPLLSRKQERLCALGQFLYMWQVKVERLT